jgi:hypothetical protein
LSEYDDLIMDDPGSMPSEPVDPKDEFFHSLYISGQERELEGGITEEANKLQVRGVKYNLSEVYCILTHVKKMQVNQTGNGRSSRLTCFSYQFGPRPYKGTDGTVCPETTKDREGVPHCSNCRANVVAAGVLTDKSGNPLLDEKKTPIFIFIRGKGIKYSGLSDYLFELYKQIDLVKIDENNEDKDRMLNRSKVVTKITKTKINTNYGDKFVFKYNMEMKLNKSVTEQILKLSAKTVEKFHEKFDWSRKKKPAVSSTGVMSFEPGEVDSGGAEEAPIVSFDDLEI